MLVTRGHKAGSSNTPSTYGCMYWYNSRSIEDPVATALRRAQRSTYHRQRDVVVGATSIY